MSGSKCPQFQQWSSLFKDQLCSLQQIKKISSKNMNYSFEISYEVLKAEQEVAYKCYPNSERTEEMEPVKGFSKNKQTKRRYLKENRYNWNDTENRRYVRFLMKQGHLLQLSTEEKKKLRINVRMSKCIKTRTSTQCHTHHQKMIEKYGNYENIIKQYSYLLHQFKKLGQQSAPEILISEQNTQIIEVMQSQEIPKESIWRQYLLPEIFEQDQEFHDNIFQL